MKPNKIKLNLKKADTNRLKADTNRLKRDTDRLKKADAESAESEVPDKPKLSLPTPPDPKSPTAASTSQISDPMSMRDTNTNRLRRIQSQDEANAVSPGAIQKSEGSRSETVRLRVVRDKKKQLADIKTASQTINLRPSEQDAGDKSVPDAAVPKQQDDAAETIKVGAGQAAEEVRKEVTATLKVKPKAVEDEKVKTPVQENQSPTLEKSEGQEKQQAEQDSATAEEKQQEPKPPESLAGLSKNATATLKIRPSIGKKPGVEIPLDAAPEIDSSTVKIKPPVDKKATTESAEAPPRTAGSKDATVTGLPRLRKPETDDAKPKISLTPKQPPNIAVAPDAEKKESPAAKTQAAVPPAASDKTGKILLNLKQKKVSGPEAKLSLPGVPSEKEIGAEEPAAKTRAVPPPPTTGAQGPKGDDAAATVALPAPEEESTATVRVETDSLETPVPGKKKSLSLKKGKGKATAVAAQPQAKQVNAAAATAEQFSTVTVAAAAILVVGLGTLTGLLLMQVMQYCF